jgi:hypothetical protein
LRVPDSVFAALQRVPSGAQSPAAGNSYRKVSTLSDSEICEAWEASSYACLPASRRLNVSRTSLKRRVNNMPDIRVVSDMSNAEIRAAFDASGGDLALAAASLRVSSGTLRTRWEALELY